MRHDEFCEKLFESAKGGDKIFHQVTKPTPRRGGAQLFARVMLHMWPEARLSVTNVKTRWEVSEEVAKGTARAQDTRQSFACDEAGRYRHGYDAGDTWFATTQPRTEPLTT